MTKEELKNEFINAPYKIKNWYYRNKKWAGPTASVVITVTPFLVRAISKRANLVKEQNLKDLYIYDRSHGHYWELRRKLSTRELLEIDKRKDKGESLVDILESMRVLK